MVEVRKVTEEEFEKWWNARLIPELDDDPRMNTKVQIEHLRDAVRFGRRRGLGPSYGDALDRLELHIQILRRDLHKQDIRVAALLEYQGRVSEERDRLEAVQVGAGRARGAEEEAQEEGIIMTARMDATREALQIGYRATDVWDAALAEVEETEARLEGLRQRLISQVAGPDNEPETLLEVLIAAWEEMHREAPQHIARAEAAEAERDKLKEALCKIEARGSTASTGITNTASPEARIARTALGEQT